MFARGAAVAEKKRDGVALRRGEKTDAKTKRLLFCASIHGAVFATWMERGRKNFFKGFVNIAE